VKGTRLADDSSRKQSNFTINSLDGSFAQIRTAYTAGAGRVQCPRGQRSCEGTVTKSREGEGRPGVGGDARREPAAYSLRLMIRYSSITYTYT
jgi:hypothetical protein